MVRVASLFLMDRVDAWCHNWIKEEGPHNWEAFERELCSRFGEEGLEDVVEEFMRIREEGTIEAYQDKFEDLRMVMPSLGEPYFLYVFMGGLRDEIRPIVRVLKPTNLAHAFWVVKFQEQFLINTKRMPAYYKTFQPKIQRPQPKFYLCS